MSGKKSEISIFVIFSVLITIIGIVLVLTFVANNRDSAKRTYCLTQYEQTGERDEYCEEFLRLEGNIIKQRESRLTHFSDGKKEGYINLTPQNGFFKSTSIELPRNAYIKSAKLKVALKEEKITLFNDDQSKQVLIVPLNRPSITKRTQALPSNIEIDDVKFEISGASYPLGADIIFIIDTSDSMANEWAAVCSKLKEIENELNKQNLDIRTGVFGLDEGGTDDFCMQASISSDQMRPLMALQEFNRNSGHENHNPCSYWMYPRTDDYSEAWALGAAWLAQNFDWRLADDIKRIIIPISDSDPTGGRPVCKNIDGGWEGKAEFSDDDTSMGSEVIAINMALQKCTDYNKWIYVLPISGDESGTVSERFDIGSEQCQYNWRCQQILQWMHELAVQTGAISQEDILPAFQDQDTIINTVLDVMTSPFPGNTIVSVSGVDVWRYDGILDNASSPQIVRSEQLRQLMQSCAGTECPITIVSDQGIIILDRLRIRYLQDPQLVSIRVASQEIDVSGQLSYSNPEVEIDVKEELQLVLESCPQNQKYCTIDIAAQGAQEGFLGFEIEVEYDYYDLEQDLIFDIIDCWRQSNEGRSDNNFLCKEIFVPEKYGFNYPITEQIVTNMFISHNLCHIISNNDFNCGDQDNIEFAQNIYNVRNILIEYKDRQVVVS
ncbi:hypothetical protein JW930_02765 [Candidatus Woesearchaeota archaeon]|nr:hypothetical protein [Candidatus Woesearchaeota archaeon]